MQKPYSLQQIIFWIYQGTFSKSFSSGWSFRNLAKVCVSAPKWVFILLSDFQPWGKLRPDGKAVENELADLISGPPRNKGTKINLRNVSERSVVCRSLLSVSRAILELFGGSLAVYPRKSDENPNIFSLAIRQMAKPHAKNKKVICVNFLQSKPGIRLFCSPKEI